MNRAIHIMGWVALSSLAAVAVVGGVLGVYDHFSAIPLLSSRQDWLRDVLQQIAGGR